MSNRDICLCGQMFSAHNKNFCITNVNGNEDKMSNFKMIKRAFPNLQVWRKPYKDDQFVVTAEELEEILQSAQVVYGHIKQGEPNYWGPKENGQFADTHTALIIGITPLKKQTKAEAALELLVYLKNGLELNDLEDSYDCKKIKAVLEMKDEV